MKNRKEIELDFVVDKLTNSIENVITGDNFSLAVDFIGDQEGLTKEEETALSAFFTTRKSVRSKGTGKIASRKEHLKA